MNVQGRVTANGFAFTGTGGFKFALVHPSGRIVFWTHDGTSGGANFEPNSSISLNVLRGLYSVMLGDTNVTGMTKPLDVSIFRNSDVRLRIWFNDGVNGFQRLIPDQRIASVGYAMRAEEANVAANVTGNITLAQLPSILVTNNQGGVAFTGSFTGDGGGLTGIRGSTPFQIADAVTNNAVANTGYLITNSIERVVLLPTTASLKVGDIIRVAGPSSWKVTQQSDQSIYSTHLRGGVGVAWAPRDNNRNWSAIASSADGVNLAAAVYGGFIYISTNSGVSWTNSLNVPSLKWLSVASSADGSRLIGGPESSNLQISNDGGETWSQRASPGARVWAGVASSSNGSNLVAVANGPIYTSLDGGETWTLRGNAPARTWEAVSCSSDGTNIFAASAGNLAGSRDGGATWTDRIVGSFFAVACSADGSRVLAASANGYLFTSTDYGTNWLRRDAAGSRAWKAVTCSAAGDVMAAAADFIYMSVDGGGAWSTRADSRGWTGITCNADATRFAATVLPGQIWLSRSATMRSTTPGTTGYLAGGEFSAIELQHLGAGKFMPISSAGSIFAY